MRNQRGDVLIPFGVFVEGLVVLHRSQFSILFSDKEEVCSVWGLRFLNGPSIEIFFDELVASSCSLIVRGSSLPGRLAGVSDRSSIVWSHIVNFESRFDSVSLKIL